MIDEELNHAYILFLLLQQIIKSMLNSKIWIDINQIIQCINSVSTI